MTMEFVRLLLVYRLTRVLNKLLFANLLGKECQQDRDCPTNIPGNPAKCKCGVNPWGKRFCDVTEADVEWQSALNAVNKYYNCL